MIEELTYSLERAFAILGGPLLLIYIVVLIAWALRRRNTRFRTWIDGVLQWVEARTSTRMRHTFGWSVVVFAVVTFLYCTLCGKTIGEEPAGHDPQVLQVIASFSLKVFPYFVAGCLLSVWIARLVGKRNRWVPKSMLGAGVFASTLPICSCAAVPFSYSLMRTGRIPIRSVITFMMVVPVLNPFVVPFSYGVLGWQYTMWRIVAAFALAMVTGVLVERLIGERDPEMPEDGCTSCAGCGKSKLSLHGPDSVIWTTMKLAANLAPYMIIGVIIGAAFTVYVPPSLVGDYLSDRFVGLVLAAGLGLPIYLCSGEDVLILAPLVKAGLPLGHAIALTLAGNGICLSSIALLVPLFGKRATVLIALSFFFGSIAIGAAINLLQPLLA